MRVHDRERALLSAAVAGWVAIQITVNAADKFRSAAVL